MSSNTNTTTNRNLSTANRWFAYKPRASVELQPAAQASTSPMALTPLNTRQPAQKRSSNVGRPSVTSMGMSRVLGANANRLEVEPRRRSGDTSLSAEAHMTASGSINTGTFAQAGSHGSPIEAGRSFTFGASGSGSNSRQSSMPPRQQSSYSLHSPYVALQAIHENDLCLMERYVQQRMYNAAPDTGSIGSGAGGPGSPMDPNIKRTKGMLKAQLSRTNKLPCIFRNTLHLCVLHRQHEMIEMLLGSAGIFDVNEQAKCTCGDCDTSDGGHDSPAARLMSACNWSPSATPDLCKLCAHMRASDIIDQSPLSVAAQTDDSDLCVLLCNHGATVFARDGHGDTPLHQAVKRSPIVWDTVSTLLIHGAKISAMNCDRVTPVQLAPELDQMQQRWVEEITLVAFGFPPSALTEISSTAGLVTGTVFGISAKHSSVSTSYRKSSQLPGQVSAKSSCAYGPPQPPWISPHSSVQQGGNELMPSGLSYLSVSAREQQERQKASAATVVTVTHNASKQPLSARSSTYLGSTATTDSNKKARDANSRRLSVFPTARSKSKSSSSWFEQNNTVSAPAWPMAIPDPNGAWRLLSLIALNHECLMYLYGALNQCIDRLDLNIVEQSIRDALMANIGCIIHRMLLTALEQYESTAGSVTSRNQHFAKLLASFISFSMQLLKNEECILKFTALATMNKVADIAIVFGLLEPPPILFETSLLLGRLGDLDAEQLVLNIPVMRTLAAVENQANSGSKTEKPMPLQQILQNLKATDRWGKIIQLVAELAGCQKTDRVTGQQLRPTCRPTQRCRYCTEHCALILACRFLLFMCHVDRLRRQFAVKRNLQQLIDLLDINMDAQVLCLLLQVLAMLAQDCRNHPIFSDLAIDDTLIQLLLPADEWYYTNHSTIFGPYVKHHAARILVYVGLGDRVGDRINLFEIRDKTRREEELEKKLNESSVLSEDDYIIQTCALPSKRIEFDKISYSPEGLLLNVFGELSYKRHEPEEEHTRDRQQSVDEGIDSHHDMDSGLSAHLCIEDLQPYLLKWAFVVSPVVMLRLTLHKLSWDLGLVLGKHRLAKVHGKFGEPTRKKSSSQGAINNCTKSFKNRNPASIKRRSEGGVDNEHKDSLSPSQAHSPRSRLALRRSSSVDLDNKETRKRIRQEKSERKKKLAESTE